MPCRDARLTTGVAIAAAERADNTMRWVGNRMLLAKIDLTEQCKQVQPKSPDINRTLSRALYWSSNIWYSYIDRNLIQKTRCVTGPGPRAHGGSTRRLDMSWPRALATQMGETGVVVVWGELMCAGIFENDRSRQRSGEHEHR